MPAFDSDINIRPASQSHASELAYLVNLAGEGLPYYLSSLSTAADQTPFDIGQEGDWILMVKSH